LPKSHLLLVGYLLMYLLSLEYYTSAQKQCSGLLVILTENKKFNIGFDSRQSRTGHPQSKIPATPMIVVSYLHCAP